MSKSSDLPRVNIEALLAGDLEGVNSVISRAKQIAMLESRQKGLPPDVIAEITQQALVECLTAIKEKKCTNDFELDQLIKRCVWRLAQRHYRDSSRIVSDFDFGTLVYDPTPHFNSIRESLILLDLQTELLNKTETDPIALKMIDVLLDEPDIGRRKLAERLGITRYEVKRTLNHLREIILSEKTELKVEVLYEEDKTPETAAQSTADLIIVDDEMIRYFKSHPKEMYSLDPRRFEELVAAILKDLGYSVELTALGADGGVDIFATQKSGIGELLVIVDCKRYAPDKHVGVGIVRALYGISEQIRANMALLATTSFFTQPAKEFQRAVKNRLSLKDYNDLVSWLDSYGQQRSKVK
jgi:HJR/Mrr/RecB family endonuclease